MNSSLAKRDPHNLAERTMGYLELKQTYLKKLLELTQTFLKTCDSECTGLFEFVQNRERLIHIIQDLEKKTLVMSELPEANASNWTAYKTQAEHLWAERNEIVRDILQCDLELMTRVENLRSQTILELQQSAHVERGLRTFRSRQKTTRRTP